MLSYTNRLAIQMCHMHSLLSGPKFSNRHQTYVPGAEDTIRALKLAPCISKIMLGEIAPARPGLRRCKVRSIQGNLIELMYRDVNAVQIIRVTTSDVSEAKALIAKFTNAARKKPDASKPKAPSKNTANQKKASKTHRAPSVTSPAYVPEKLGKFFSSMEGLQLQAPPPAAEISAERMAVVNAETFPLIQRAVEGILLNTYLKVGKSENAIRWALERVADSLIVERVKNALGGNANLYSLAEISASVEDFRKSLGRPR